MTMYAYILNLTDAAVKVELQGRDPQGQFTAEDEKIVKVSNQIQIGLWKGTQGLIAGPATALIVNGSQNSPAYLLKVETQDRDEQGRFVREHEDKARILKPGEFYVFSVRKGQQLQLHEKMAS